MKKNRVSALAAAEHIGLTRQSFSARIRDGVVKHQTVADGYNLTEVRLAELKHLRAVAAGRGGTDAVQVLSSARARQAVAAAESGELKNRILSGEYAPVKAMTDMYCQHVAVARERGLGMAGEIADSLTPFTPKDRAAIYEIVDGAIRQMMDALSVHTLTEEKNKAPDVGDDDAGDDDDGDAEVVSEENDNKE